MQNIVCEHHQYLQSSLAFYIWGASRSNLPFFFPFSNTFQETLKITEFYLPYIRFQILLVSYPQQPMWLLQRQVAIPLCFFSFPRSLSLLATAKT